jgi:hypothetical protein
VSAPLSCLLAHALSFGMGALFGWGIAHLKRDRSREEMERLDRRLAELQDKLRLTSQIAPNPSPGPRISFASCAAIRSR